MIINNYFVKIKEKLGVLYKKNKKLFFVALAVLFVVCLMFFVPQKKSQTTQVNHVSGGESSYVDKIESKIKNLLSNISTINLVDVMVVVESSEIINYLTQKETIKSGDSITEKEEIVYEKNGSTQTPISVSVTYPKICGVILILNKIDASTKLSIQNALSGVLNIDSNCIFILQDR